MKNHLDESIKLQKNLYPLIPEIKSIGDILVKAFVRGNKVLVAGNGGSAADSQHMAAELIGRFKMERVAYPCVALTTDSSIITAWSNDYDFSTVFARQVEGLGLKGDVFVGLSTSGNSENIIEAVSKATQKDLTTILLLGKDGGSLKDMSENVLLVPHLDTARIQETHILIIHMLCDYVEKQFALNM